MPAKSIILQRKEILLNALKYAKSNKSEITKYAKQSYTKLIDVISQNIEGDWQPTQILLQYNKSYGEGIPMSILLKMIDTLVRGGGLVKRNQRTPRGEEPMYSVATANVGIYYADVRKPNSILPIPMNEELDKMVRSIIRKHKVKMVTATLTIYTKKK